MKTYRFELLITEQDVSGDEFWEEVISEDETGITGLKEAIWQALKDSNLILSKDFNGLKLTEYKDS